MSEEIVPKSPAEERADREGMRVVRCLPHELIRAATGNPIVVSTADGEEVLLRLATVDEFIDINRQALATLPEDFRPAPVTREKAEELVRPMAVEW